LKRAFAARCFALSPLNQDQEYILKLFDDSNFQVKSLVIPAIVHLKIKEGVVKILENMSQNAGYFRYYYLDTLVSAKSPEIYDWIEEIAQNNPNRKLQLACLDVLSGKMQTIQGSFLTRDVDSPYEEIRFAAIKVFARNPQKDSLEVLLSHVADTIEEIRKESYRGLEHFRSPRTLQVLEKGLSDSNWDVRTQAANSLKNMGRAGLDILNKQNPSIDPNAYEVAHFILQLDW
jgi:HEAT repeat protein